MAWNFFVLGLLPLLFGLEVHGQPTKAVAPAISPSWRDLSYDRRCEGLLDFLKAISAKDVPGWTVRKPRCVISGSAAGDATWMLDVDYVKGSQAQPVRYIVDEPKKQKPSVSWCVFNGDRSACASPWDSTFKLGDLFKKAESAQSVYDALIKRIPGLLNVVTNLDEWIGRQGKSEKIFGMDYREWIGEWVKSPRRLPLKDGEIHATFEAELENPKLGTVLIKKPIPQALKDCLKCEKKLCDKAQFNYEFSGTGLMLIRPLTLDEEKLTGLQMAKATWIMLEPSPYEGRQPKWHFLCGENRYNIQKL